MPLSTGLRRPDHLYSMFCPFIPHSMYPGSQHLLPKWLKSAFRACSNHFTKSNFWMMDCTQVCVILAWKNSQVLFVEGMEWTCTYYPECPYLSIQGYLLRRIEKAVRQSIGHPLRASVYLLVMVHKGKEQAQQLLELLAFCFLFSDVAAGHLLGSLYLSANA